MQDDYRWALQVRSVGFSALLCISFGLILLFCCLFLARAKPAAFFASGIVGVTAIVLMYRRIAKHWRAGIALERGVSEGTAGNLRRPSFLLAILFLAGTGYVGAQAAGTGWATPFIPYLMFLFLFPWSRIPLCRTSLATSLAMPCAGLIAGLVTTARLPHPLALAITVWMLWTAAVFAWLRLILIDRQQLRASRAAGRHTTEKPGNAPEMLHNSSITQP